MGIGNFDRADDEVGLAVVEALEKLTLPDNIKIINAGPVPEAFTGVIRRENPDYLIVVDAAQMDDEPGAIRVFTEKNVDSAYMITPHQVSMTMYMKFLRNELKKLKVLFIGIQPKTLTYMEAMCPEVKASVDFLVKYLEDLMRK